MNWTYCEDEHYHLVNGRINKVVLMFRAVISGIIELLITLALAVVLGAATAAIVHVYEQITK